MIDIFCVADSDSFPGSSHLLYLHSSQYLHSVLRHNHFLIQHCNLLSLPDVKMILSRAKPAIAGDKNDPKENRGSAKKQIPTIEEFLSKRDYTGEE